MNKLTKKPVDKLSIRNLANTGYFSQAFLFIYDNLKHKAIIALCH